MAVEHELPGTIILALRLANDSVRLSSAKIRDSYALAEFSGDYSDADEMAADHREHLHDEFGSLLEAFANTWPDLFDTNVIPPMPEPYEPPQG